MKKLRKKKRANNLNRALDEHDDVDDSDLVAGPAKRQRIGMGIPSDGDGDSSEDEEEDGIVDGDGDEEEVEEKVVKRQDKEGESDRLEKRNTKRRKQA